jgi:kynurenine formamidase
MTAPAGPPVDLESFRALFDRVSNWGRWGPDDQRGTLNLLGPEATRAAAALIRTGDRVACARALKIGAGTRPGAEFLHHMLVGGEEAEAAGMSSTADWFAMGIHGFDFTHLDSPAHIVWDDRLYNGVPASEVSTSRGALRLSVDLAADGVTGRGLLVDGPAIKGRPWMEPGESLNRAEVEGWCQEHGLEPAPGDIAVFRFGRDEAERRGVALVGEEVPGLALDCAEWFADRDVAAVVSDAITDTVPAAVADDCRLPLHVLALVAMGMWVVDNADLGRLAEACTAQDRWSFFFSLQPLNLKRSTGSPLTPLAIF